MNHEGESNFEKQDQRIVENAKVTNSEMQERKLFWKRKKVILKREEVNFEPHEI